jgi:hypothetical protein
LWRSELEPFTTGLRARRSLQATGCFDSASERFACGGCVFAALCNLLVTTACRGPLIGENFGR